MKKILKTSCLLGLLAVSGCGVDELTQLRKDAERGNAEAQRLLGDRYFSGTDVAQDYTESERLYLLSAQQGNLKAQRHLGFSYYSGTGMAQDYAKAVQWLRPVAETGNPEAQVLLGSCYFLGKGVQRDYAMAYAWCSTSINRQNANAKRVCELSMARMNDEQKEKARRLALLYEKKFVKN
jgi:uncharacterized protein